MLLAITVLTENIVHAETSSLDKPSKMQRELNFFLQHYPKEYTHTLKNGLKIIAIPYSGFNIARFQIIYYVGANDEEVGDSGISHVVEHMLFRGTKNHSRAEYNQLFAYSSADANAETARSYTSFFTTSTIDNLPKVFELEADQMNNALFEPHAFKTELEVVKQEQRQRAANQNTILTTRIMASSYITGAFHHPVIGWINDLNKMTLEKAKSWYKRWYHPNNATILVCGNIEPSKIFALAERNFGSIPNKTITRSENSELGFIGKRTVEIHFPHAIPSIEFFYGLPDVSKMSIRELAALNALSEILTVKLEKKTPNFTSFDLAFNTDPINSSFSIIANFSTDDYVARINLIADYIDALKSDTPADKTFEIIEQDLLNEKKELLNWLVAQGDSISSITALVSLREELQWSQADLIQYFYETILLTKDDLHAVATKYLTENKLTIGIVKKGDSNNAPME